jgi:hypothetical protein
MSPVAVVSIDRLAGHSSRRHVIRPAGELNARRTRHSPTVSRELGPIAIGATVVSKTSHFRDGV